MCVPRLRRNNRKFRRRWRAFQSGLRSARILKWIADDRCWIRMQIQLPAWPMGLRHPRVHCSKHSPSLCASAATSPTGKHFLPRNTRSAATNKRWSRPWFFDSAMPKTCWRFRSNRRRLRSPRPRPCLLPQRLREGSSWKDLGNHRWCWLVVRDRTGARRQTRAHMSRFFLQHRRSFPAIANCWTRGTWYPQSWQGLAEPGPRTTRAKMRRATNN